MPGASALYSAGELHGAKASPFSEHSKVACCSSAEKRMFASGLPVTAAGPKSIVVCGAVSSTTFHTWVAGTCSTIASGLWTWTSKVCWPSARPL